MRRHDSIWMAYVRNTASTDSAIHPGLRASDTCSERKSLQLRAMARHTITTTNPAAPGLGIAGQLVQRAGEGCDVVRGDQPSGSVRRDDVGHAAPVGGRHHGDAE